MKRIALLLLGWSLLWLGGSFWAALGLQTDLEREARTLLASTADTRVVTSRLEVKAEGQTLRLSGTASRAGDQGRASSLLREKVRLEGLQGYGAQFNPVSQVVDAVVLEPKPAGWGILAGTPFLLQLTGVAGSELEGQSIASGLNGGGQWSSVLRNQLEEDAEACAESDHLEGTTGSTLTITDEALNKGLLAVARWGEAWAVLDVDLPPETLRRRLLEAGMPARAWSRGVSAEVERVREARLNWRSSLAERDRQEAQPPGHVVLALRGDAILLKGELGSPQSCKLVADAVRKGAESRRVLEEVVPSTRRRPEKDMVKLSTTVPPLPGGLTSRLLAVGTPAGGWKLIDLEAFDGEDENALGTDLLPPGLDPRLVLPDVLSALGWIHSIDSTPMPASDGRPSPFVMIAALGDRVYLRGTVAEETSRTQIEDAARKFYTSRSLDAGIQIDTSVASVATVLPTVSALPNVPAENSTGMIAIAQVGEGWRSKPMRSRFLESQGLAESNLLPDGVAVNQVMPALLDLADRIQAHLSRVLGGAPGIPLQNP